MWPGPAPGPRAATPPTHLRGPRAPPVPGLRLPLLPLPLKVAKPAFLNQRRVALVTSLCERDPAFVPGAQTQPPVALGGGVRTGGPVTPTEPVWVMPEIMLTR